MSPFSLKIGGLSLAALWMGLACNPAPSDAMLDQTRGGRLDVFFNEPGTRNGNLWEPDAIKMAIEMIQDANATIDIAVMGFTRLELIEPLIDAYDRGVKVRFVGDAGHLNNIGYRRFSERHIPMSSGNLVHIMHDKFIVIDHRFVFSATANFTDTDLRRNSNNFLVMDSPPIAADFTTEFEQMFEGAFGYMKKRIDNGRVYQVGDTEVEVWFSPNEDVLGRMLELVNGAKDSVRFTIFAFTKDQIGSALVRKQEEFTALNAVEPGLQDGDGPFTERTVAGVIDQSQLHSNGQYHEVFRLMGAGIPVRMDGVDNSRQPGDYQAGGGRLHSKTMIIDAYGEDPIVITGSFNWSSSATLSNDEYLMVMKGPRIAKEFDKYFMSLWDQGRHPGGDSVSGQDVQPGDVVINEVMWYGANQQDQDGFDEFIELRNTTDRTIDLNLWSIANPDDFVVGFPPGSFIEPRGLFTILDHTLEPYADGMPQDQVSAYKNGDLVLNAFNDNRQSRLYLKDGVFELILKDPHGEPIDFAGDGSAAFYGGPSGGVIRSMERNDTPADGAQRAAWHTCSLDAGGQNVNDAFKGQIMASPGEPNSP